MLKCKKLGEYSYFVESVRKHYSINKNFPVAVDEAVKECIDKGILADFLKKHIAEVRTVLLTEFDEERDYKIIAEGYKELWKEEGRKDIIKTMLSNGATKETILKLTGITELEFDNIMNS